LLAYHTDDVPGDAGDVPAAQVRLPVPLRLTHLLAQIIAVRSGPLQSLHRQAHLCRSCIVPAR
jgi:hypothetical protein